MIKCLLFFACAALSLMLCQNAHAHSRQGLERITLQSETLIPDQIAFYLEPHVNNRIDEDGRKFRYQLWEFNEIKVHDGLAEVHVLINDSRTAQQSPEVLYLQRNTDNTWNHIEADGQIIEERIYTFVNPDGSISSGGHGPVTSKAGGHTYFMAAGVVVLGGLGILLARRRRKNSRI